MICFSNNYLCKATPGCAGSGVFKNVLVELRNSIMDIMVRSGLLLVGQYLSGMKMDSFIKLTPNALRQNENSVKLFSKFGSDLPLNNYEKLFETFGLLTTTNNSIVPFTSSAIALLKKDDNFVTYYHCVDKEVQAQKMINERIHLNEIHFLSNFSNGVHRYELKNVDRRDLDAMFNRNSFTNVDHTEISETLATTTTTFAGQSSSSELICSRK